MSDSTEVPGGTGDAARGLAPADRAGEGDPSRDRRGFLGALSSLFMAGGITAGYAM